MANEDQITYWNEKAGPRWVTMNDALDATIADLGRAMLDRAAIRPGESVLDVGCGCGTTTLDIGRRVGPAGSVLGADISRPMLGLAKARSTRDGLKHVSFDEADAQTYSFKPTAFDAAVSRFGVMFFQDPAAAFANIRKALKPGGRVAFVCWRNIKENPWMLAPLMAAAQHIQLPEPPAPDQPGPFSFADGDRVERILSGAGYQSITIEAYDTKTPGALLGTPEEAADFFSTIGPVAALLEEATDETRAKVLQSMADVFRGFQSSEGIRMAQAAWIVTARNG